MQPQIVASTSIKENSVLHVFCRKDGADETGVGLDDGAPVGACEFITVGDSEPATVGLTELKTVGASEGPDVTVRLGCSEPIPVGACESTAVGDPEIATAGLTVGNSELTPDGDADGASTHSIRTTLDPLPLEPSLVTIRRPQASKSTSTGRKPSSHLALGGWCASKSTGLPAAFPSSSIAT